MRGHVSRHGFFIASVVLAGACLPEATRPRSGIPTLDDAAAGPFSAVSAGGEHTCGLANDGTAYCWGSNEFGQLGVSETGQTCARGDRMIPCSTVALPVETPLRFAAIAAGGVHTCAIALDQRIHCWGDNLRGALGDPGVRASAAPIAIASTSLFLAVAAGAEHTCAVRLDGVGACWGSNEWGQIGIGSSNASVAAPAAIGGGARFASITAGGHRSCGRLLDGTGFCWGRSWAGIGGTSEGRRPQTTPARVPGDLVFRSLDAGVNTTCGITTGNVAYCWEANFFGTIGDGSVAASQAPRPVDGGSFSAIRSGESQTCGIDDAGYAYCWGAGALGELGVSPVLLHERCGASRVPCSVRPVRVSGWRQFSAISPGQGSHSCALSFGGNVYCWGAGDMGQRGDGRTSAGEWSPVKVGTRAALAPL